MSDIELTCHYTEHKNGIHEFVLLKANRQSVDEYLYHIDQIYATSSPATTHLLLIDIRQSGMPPIGYITSSVRQFNQDHPVRHPSRVAIFYQSGFVLTMLETALQLLARPEYDTVRLFANGKREEAVAWLLQT